MSLLKNINSPADLKQLSRKELPVLAAEIRKTIVDVVSQTGGHLASSLGAVELAIAIHYVFDTPQDKLIWDVGHQAYAHKLLTGRRDQFHSLRQHGGIAGFTRIEREPVRYNFNRSQQYFHIGQPGCGPCQIFKKGKVQSNRCHWRWVHDSRSCL